METCLQKYAYNCSYQKHRYHIDEEFRLKKQSRNRSYYYKKLQEDPLYLLKISEKRKAKYSNDLEYRQRQCELSRQYKARLKD